MTPALAAIQRAGDHVAHGALSADRIIVTRDGRLVVVEHVLGSAIEALKPTRARLQELGLVVPAGPEPITFDARTDMAQLGFIALSLLLGRRLDPADYPANVQSLFDEYVQGGSSPILAGKMRGWLEKALQVSVRSFTSARDAHDAFKDLPDEMDVKISESGRGLLEFNSEPTPAPMPIPDIRNEHVVEPLKDERKDERKPHLFVANPTPARMPIPTLPAPEPVSKPAVQKAPPARPFARYVPWVMGALVLVAAAEGVALFVLPYTKSSSAVVEVKSPDLARTNPVPPPATPQPVATTPTPAASVAAETAPAAKATDASLAAAAPVVPSGPRFGAVTVTSPIELQVFKDGQVVGSSVGSIALGEGPHVLEFVNEALGFKYRQTVSVKNGQMTSVKIAVPNGRISINAAPWAEVLIDGAPAGETPLANLSLPIGSHEIVFRHPQLGEKKQTVVVKVEGLLKITQAMDAK